jgi:hypothetical protein
MKTPINEVALWSKEQDLEYVAMVMARPKVIRLTIQLVEFPKSHDSHARNRKGLEL